MWQRTAIRVAFSIPFGKQFPYSSNSLNKAVPVAWGLWQALGMAQRVKVLIVDDNAGIRRVLKRAIQEIAEPIWECSDGAEALKSYMDHRPDVVLMDIRMPLVDGLEATHQILGFDPAARVVIVTDYDDNDLRHVASEAGACAYWLKENLANLQQQLLRLIFGK